MYLGVFEHGKFISEVHFSPKRRNLKISRLIEIPQNLVNSFPAGAAHSGFSRHFVYIIKMGRKNQ